MGRKFVDGQPGEMYSFCEGYRPLRDANRLLKHHGLVIRYRGHPDMGDGVFLRIEKLPKAKKKKPKAKRKSAGKATESYDYGSWHAAGYSEPKG